MRNFAFRLGKPTGEAVFGGDGVSNPELDALKTSSEQAEVSLFALPAESDVPVFQLEVADSRKHARIESHDCEIVL